MSAKDARKCFLLTLPPELAGAVRAYAALQGDKSLAASCRRLLRSAARGDCTPPPLYRPSRRPLRLRLQLEPALREFYEMKPAPARAIEAVLALQLGVAFDDGGGMGSNSSPRKPRRSEFYVQF